MANITIPIPDAIIPDLAKALALRMGAPEPTTNPERVDIVRQSMKQQAKQVLLDYRSQEAARVARENPSDEAVTW